MYQHEHWILEIYQHEHWILKIYQHEHWIFGKFTSTNTGFWKFYPIDFDEKIFSLHPHDDLDNCRGLRIYPLSWMGSSGLSLNLRFIP